MARRFFWLIAAAALSTAGCAEMPDILKFDLSGDGGANVVDPAVADVERQSVSGTAPPEIVVASVPEAPVLAPPEPLPRRVVAADVPAGAAVPPPPTRPGEFDTLIASVLPELNGTPAALEHVETGPHQKWVFRIVRRPGKYDPTLLTYHLYITNAASVPILELKGGRVWKKVKDINGNELEALLAGTAADCTFFDCNTVEVIDVALDDAQAQKALASGMPLTLEGEGGVRKVVSLPPASEARREVVAVPRVEVGPAIDRPSR